MYFVLKILILLLIYYYNKACLSCVNCLDLQPGSLNVDCDEAKVERKQENACTNRHILCYPPKQEQESWCSQQTKIFRGIFNS